MSPGSLQWLFGGDNGITQTANAIVRLIHASARSPDQQIRTRAEFLVRGLTPHDDEAEIAALFNYVRNHFHYVSDPSNIEFVKSPEVLDHEVTSSSAFFGDCDDAVCYLGALLTSIGYPVRLVVTAPAVGENGIPQSSSEFTHIYLKVLRRGGTWEALDPTALNKPQGWEVPSVRTREYGV